MYRTRSALAVGALAAVAAGALGGTVGGERIAAIATVGPLSSQRPSEIAIHDNYFDPRSATLSAGSRVRWVWKGKSRHEVVFRRIRGRAPVRRVRARSNGQASRSFTVPGIYRYLCSLYDGMEGTLIVNPGGRSAPDH